MFGIEDYTQKIVDFANFEPSQLMSALIFGGAVLLIGIMTVFAVLIVLWICLTVFKLCFAAKKSKKSAKSDVQSEISSTRTVSDDSEIIAVIAAAIAAAESESDGIKFKVVSFRRK